MVFIIFVQRLVGFHRPYSSTYAVMLNRLPGGICDRRVHNKNVTFNDEDYVIPREKTQHSSHCPAIADATGPE